MTEKANAARVRHLLAERSTAEDQGLKERVLSIDKELRAAGYSGERKVARDKAPEERSTRPQETTDQPRRSRPRKSDAS